MEDRLRINIKIADSKHPLFVNTEDEAVVRKAATLLNNKIARYADKYRTADLSPVQILTFAAMDIAVKYLKQDASSSAEDAETDIESLVADLRQYLNK